MNMSFSFSAMPIDFSKIRLLIIDLDNTLCDTFHTLSKPQWEFVKKKLVEKGWDEPAELLEKNFGKKGFKTTLEESGMSPEQMEYAIEQYDDVDVSPLELFPDATYVLDLDIPKVLLSRGEPELQERKIAHLDLRKQFRDIEIVDTFHTKTDAIRDIVRRHDVRPDEALIVGDRLEEEIMDGNRLGIPAVLVRRPDWPVHEGSARPDLVVENLKQLVDRLRP